MKKALAFSAAIAAAATPANLSALTISEINVTSAPYCTVTNGSVDNTSCIQSAINAVQAVGGGTVYFPCGDYLTTSPVRVTASAVKIRGEGMCTRWRGRGGFNTLEFVGSVGGQIYKDSLSGIYFLENGKSGGRTMFIYQVGLFSMQDVLVDDSSCGIHFQEFNEIVVERLRIQRTNGNGCASILLSANNGSRADVANFRDTVVQGDSRFNGDGMIIDGAVFTVSAHKIYFVNVPGHALRVTNSSGGSQNPEFITMYGLEADFPLQTGIWLEKGSGFHFTDTQIGGSAYNSNIYISPDVSRVTFQGGSSTGARLAGMDIFGNQVSVTGVDISNNSNPDVGGTAGAWSGVVLEAQSRMVTLTGLKSGTPSAPNRQRYGVQVNSGADQYAIVGNMLVGNALGGFSGASGTSSKVVANNVQ